MQTLYIFYKVWTDMQTTWKYSMSVIYVDNFTNENW